MIISTLAIDNMLTIARDRLRVSHHELDNDIIQLIKEAVSDIVRIGIEIEEFDDVESTDPLLLGTVLCYVKANYGNNPDREKLMESYHMYLTKLKGR